MKLIECMLRMTCNKCGKTRDVHRIHEYDYERQAMEEGWLHNSEYGHTLCDTCVSGMKKVYLTYTMDERGNYTNLRFIFENIDEANDWCMKNNSIFIEKLMYDKAFS